MFSLQSSRFKLKPLSIDCLDEFHGLCIDEHIKRYLMDGKSPSIEWAQEQLLESNQLFKSSALGLWLLYEKEGNTLVGFAGFVKEADVYLVYALIKKITGRGMATEVAKFLLDYSTNKHVKEVYASVDEANAASIRILEKLGFYCEKVTQGPVGNLLKYKRETSSSPSTKYFIA